VIQRWHPRGDGSGAVGSGSASLDLAATVHREAAAWFRTADKQGKGLLPLPDIATITRQLFYHFGLPAPDQEAVERGFRAYGRLQANESVMIDVDNYVKMCDEIVGGGN